MHFAKKLIIVLLFSASFCLAADVTSYNNQELAQEIKAASTRTKEEWCERWINIIQTYPIQTYHQDAQKEIRFYQLKKSQYGQCLCIGLEIGSQKKPSSIQCHENYYLSDHGYSLTARASDAPTIISTTTSASKDATAIINDLLNQQLSDPNLMRVLAAIQQKFDFQNK